MHFKIDENLPVEARDIFLRSGFEATTVGDENLSGTTDFNIAAICQEEQRAIITLAWILPTFEIILPLIIPESSYCACNDKINTRY